MRRTYPTLLLATVSLFAMVLATAGPVVAADPPTEAVVVRSGNVDTAAALVMAHGGQVTGELPLIGAVSAELAPQAVVALRSLPDLEVAPDVEIRFASAGVAAPPAPALQRQAMNLPEGWGLESGAGVGVALVDTGVAAVPQLTGRVVHGPDLSGEGDGIDRYGHGTFMAGLIAAAPVDGDTVGVVGVAPGAHLVSVKVAGADGVTSLSRIIEAIGWVVTNQDEHGIRVLNLSVAVTLPLSWQADPLSAAVQAAWSSGITVVAASGNDGEGTVTSPGRDPWVLTVGASDPNGTPEVVDDTVADWSGRGRIGPSHKPDVLAPGVSTISLRVPGSYVDGHHPEGRVGEHHFRGSGTSMSTALVSGGVALLAELRPFATPDDLKGAVVATGHPIADSTAPAVDLAAADLATPDAAWRQHHPIAFDGLDGRLSQGMPWNHLRAPSPEQAWTRARWVDEGFARARWVEANLARARWVDANLARARWVEADWSRARWVTTEWADLIIQGGFPDPADIDGPRDGAQAP